MTSRRPNSRHAHRAAAVFLWIAGRAISSGSPVPYGLALGVVGLVYLGDSAPEQRLALASPPPQAPRHLTASSGPSCPLPVGQQAKAVRAFRAMMPVFRHPRCLNCHGGVDPLSPQHKGVGELDLEIDRMVDREGFEEQCQLCHDEMPGLFQGWTTPGPAVFFVDKDDEELCLQMKQFEKTGEEFVEHIDNDHFGIQFIAAGFAGDRALGEQGLIDHEVVAEKPPGTQADLVAKAQKWVDAVGDGYTASPECGCVMPKIKVEVHHTEVFELPGGLPSKTESEAQFEVDLEPLGDQRPNMYAGQQSVNRDIKLTLPPACKGKGSRQERWTLYAAVDPESGSITVTRMMQSDEVKGDIECKQGGGIGTTRLLPDEGAGTMLGYGELVLPADSGSSKTVTGEYPATRESLTITVLEVPAGE